jgi:hypothetical protein
MNSQNYASLEASQRLYEAGIVLETEFHWICDIVNTREIWTITLVDCHSTTDNREYPTPSMAEVWRELPEVCNTGTGKAELTFNKIERNNGVVVTSANYIYDDVESGCCTYKYFASVNPADALVDLLIWVRKEKVC